KLRRHLDKLLNYFRFRISNAQAESLNGRIEKIKRIAHGYRNLENFKTAIYFHFGALDLYPGTHGKA
ncbi:MAG TPA: transposase, partial [Thermoanaerobaculia bacterium]|nr:transposase [Thermoanaerobaculia bacterium]